MNVFIVVTVIAIVCQVVLKRKFESYGSFFKSHTHANLREMFLFVDVTKVWLASIIISAFTAITAFLITGYFVFSLVTFVVVLALPPFTIKIIRSRRIVQIERQLPDFLLSLSSTLKSGAGLQVAFKSVAENTCAPLRQELDLLLKEQRMGLSFADSLKSFRSRISADSINITVSALMVCIHSGGNLSEILDNLSKTMRSRQAILGRIKALTSQGRMQAVVMCCLPLFLGGALYWLDPNGTSILWKTSAGIAVLTIVVVFEVVGLLFIKKIISIDV